ncbi:MAG: hypothetical protein HY394_04200 [Candidatus Diapherotrites archaeon]|nr:hypothetical protein [Candidatus Diapherotrites archaeon]
MALECRGFHCLAVPGKADFVQADLTLLSGFPESKGFVQVLPAQIFVSERQVFSALEQSVSAFASGSGTSKKMGLDFLGRFCGTPRISDAVSRIKFSSGAQSVVAVMCLKNAGDESLALSFLSKNFGFAASEKSLPAEKARLEGAKNFYSVSAKELSGFSGMPEGKAVELLVLERIAMAGL